MFDELFGPSTIELAQAIREFSAEVLAHRYAMLQLLQEKGHLTEEDLVYYEKTLVVRNRAAVDRGLAQGVDNLRSSDTPEGARFHQREALAKSFEGLFGTLFGAADKQEEKKEDSDQSGKLPSSGEE